MRLETEGVVEDGTAQKSRGALHDEGGNSGEGKEAMNSSVDAVIWTGSTVSEKGVDGGNRADAMESSDDVRWTARSGKSEEKLSARSGASMELLQYISGIEIAKPGVKSPRTEELAGARTPPQKVEESDLRVVTTHEAPPQHSANEAPSSRGGCRQA